MHIVIPDDEDDDAEDESTAFERRHPGMLDAIAQAEREISLMSPKEQEELYQRALRDVRLGR